MSQQTKTVVLDNLATSTWYSIRKEVTETAFNNTPVWNKLIEAGRVKEKAPQGTHWEVPFSYDKQDQNIGYFTRGSLFGTAEKETLTMLLFYTKNIGAGIVRYWDDDRKIKGTAQAVDYVSYKLESTKNALVDKLNTDLIVQSTDVNCIDALATLISTTPTTGTVGGLSRSANSGLQNQIKSFTGMTTGVSLLDEMDTMWNKCSVLKAGAGKSNVPNMIICSRRVYQDYERICRAMQQIITNKTERASLGFGELMFKNCEMFWDNAVPDGYMYFINTDTIEVNYDPSAWFEMTEWKPLAGNSLDRTAQIVSVLNLTTNGMLAKNGVIFNISPTTN